MGRLEREGDGVECAGLDVQRASPQNAGGKEESQVPCPGFQDTL